MSSLHRGSSEDPEDLIAEIPMAGHEFPEPADRKRQVADPTATPQAAEETRQSCDPAFKHGVVVGFDGSTSSE
ncbi:MAG TPA: universal stress protein, partial [Streptomyces sp.]